MTPCALQDGATCFATTAKGDPACVGCGWTPADLGMRAPADWPTAR